MILDEPEMLDGARAWYKTQELFLGVPDQDVAAVRTQASWYDTSVDDNQGAFAMVQIGAGLDDLVGEIVRVTVGKAAPIFVYVHGRTPDVFTPFALDRRAWFEVEDLAVDEVEVVVEVTIQS